MFYFKNLKCTVTTPVRRLYKATRETRQRVEAGFGHALETAGDQEMTVGGTATTGSALLDWTGIGAPAGAVLSTEGLITSLVGAGFAGVGGDLEPF